MPEVERTFDPTTLTEFVTRAFAKVGLPGDDAAIAAQFVVATDLRGIDSHGLPRLAQLYIRGLREGRINPRPAIKTVSQTATTATIDGDRGLGFVIGHYAMTDAMRRADSFGAGFVAVRNSTHFGAGGNYSMMALPRDMVGIALTKGPKEALVPGSLGRGGFINVISIAAPAGTGAPFVLDMATTVVAAGKLEIKRRDGKSLPEGWAVDKDGRHMADPGQYRAEGSALLPLGGSPLTGSYKGFGLSVAVEVLCGVLSGSASLTAEGPIGPVSHFFGALRINGFGPPDEFRRSMDEMARYYRSLPRAAGVDRVYLAGEPEWEIEKVRKNGIPLHSSVIRSLRDMASELGLEFGVE